ncbi:MAG: hypothetical protein AAF434_03510 [Pseudomonadota bacterium]
MSRHCCPPLVVLALSLLVSSCFSDENEPPSTHPPTAPSAVEIRTLAEPPVPDPAAVDALNAQRESLKEAQLLREQVERELEAIRADLAASDAALEQKQQAVEDLQSEAQESFQN